ncbi:MAG: hypothetical protein ACLPKE_25485, partial [Streptosporangiaceae bacterium]
MRLLPVTAVPLPLQGILPDDFQQPEPRLIVAGLRPGQAAVHQRTQRVDDVARPARARRDGVTDGFGGWQAERPGE